MTAQHRQRPICVWCGDTAERHDHGAGRLTSTACHDCEVGCDAYCGHDAWLPMLASMARLYAHRLLGRWA